MDNSAAFHKLVRKVCDEHDREVESLVAKLGDACCEIEQLRSEIQKYEPVSSRGSCVQEFQAIRDSHCSKFSVEPGPGVSDVEDYGEDSPEEEAEPAPKPKIKRQSTGAFLKADLPDDDEESDELDDVESEGADKEPSQDGTDESARQRAMAHQKKVQSRPMPSRGAWSDEAEPSFDLAIAQPPLTLAMPGKEGGLRISPEAGSSKPRTAPTPLDDPPQLVSVVPLDEGASNGKSRGSWEPQRSADSAKAQALISLDTSSAGPKMNTLSKSLSKSSKDMAPKSKGSFLSPLADTVRRLSGQSPRSSTKSNGTSAREDHDRDVKRTLSGRTAEMLRNMVPGFIHSEPTPISKILPTEPAAPTKRITWSQAVDEQESKMKRNISQTFKVRQRWMVDEKSLKDKEQRESKFKSLITKESDPTAEPGPKRLSRARSSLALDDMLMDQVLSSKRRTFLDAWVSTPNSRFNFVWDILSMGLIGYDVVMIPFDVFSPDDTVITSMMGFVTGIFWLMDIVRTFFTGYISKGDIVMQFRDVAKNYLMTWFVIDSTIVCFDWTYLISKHSGSSAGQVTGFQKHVRGLRSARGLRLLRGVKMARIIKTIEDRFTSERNSVLFNVLMLFIGLVLLNHVVACIWYAIGKACQGNIDSWVDHYLENSDDIWYRYFTSFHWALTQFTPASIAVQPHNVYERLFGVIVLLFALVSVSSFVSGITSAVMFLRNLGSTKSKQFWLLRRFLRESEVPTALAIRIQRHCDFAWQSRETRLQEKNVQALGLLSAALRADMNTAILEPRLWKHPLFILFSKLAPNVVSRLCNSAVTRSTLVRGDLLFQLGDTRTCCDVLVSGNGVYAFGELTEKQLPEKPQEVFSDQWMCETCLWVSWVCVGVLTTVSDCDIVTIDSDKFAQVIRGCEELKLEAAVYARGFVHGMNNTSRVTDLHRPISQIEGLWFRLLNEYNVKQKESVRRSSRSSAMFPGVFGGIKEVEE